MRTFVLSLAIVTMVGAYAAARKVRDRTRTPASSAISYTARSDFKVVPVPSTVPSMGGTTGAGTSVIDPDFGTTIYRLTDINTFPNARNALQQNWQMNCGGWAAFRVSNVNSTKLFVCNNGGGTLLLPFDSSTGKAGKAQRLPAAVSGYPHWSKKEQDTAFAFEREKLEVLRIDFSGSHPNVTPVVDLGKIPNCAKDSPGTRGWRELSAAWDDATFAVAAGPGNQNTAHMVYVWNAKMGCHTYDTEAETVDGAKVSGATDSFLVHAIKISGDGKVVMVGGGKQRHFWRVGTSNVDVLRHGGINQGHFAMGYSSFLNTAGLTSDGKWCKLGMAIWNLSTLATARYLLSSRQCGNDQTPGDDHVSWNNDDTSDSLPFAISTGRQDGLIEAPWQDEILVITSDGTVHREAHTFNSGKSKFFACKNAIGSISQDGKWFFFSSDWEESLGKDALGNDRCDDFAVKLH